MEQARLTDGPIAKSREGRKDEVDTERVRGTDERYRHRVVQEIVRADCTRKDEREGEKESKRERERARESERESLF